jgi:transcriptional regulator with XRE-family HTH domain
MNARVKFSRNLRYMRTIRGLSIQDTSVDLDVQVSRFRMWEAGKAVPGCELLVLIADYFDVTLDTLFRIDMEYTEYPYYSIPQGNG